MKTPESFPQIPESAPDAKTKIPIDNNSTREDNFMSTPRFKGIQKKRLSDLKGHVHFFTIVTIYVVGSMYLVAMGVWFYHLLMPADYQFMIEKNHATLQNILFGTIVGGFIRQLANKVFND